MNHELALLQLLQRYKQKQHARADASVSEAQHRAMEAAAHGESTLGIPKSVGEEFVRKDEARADANWITVHPNGKDSTGQPALIGDDGTVLGGMGGKFNGKNIKDAHGTERFTSHETNAETEARHKEEAAKKDNLSDTNADSGKVAHQHQDISTGERREFYSVNPVSNAAGVVKLSKYGYPEIDVKVSPAMKAAGIKKLGTPLRITQDQKLGEILEINANGTATAKLKLSDKPELAELARNYFEIKKDYNAESDKKINAEKAKSKAEDDYHLGKMREKAQELEAKIPEGGVKVKFVEAGNIDGDKSYDAYANGVKLSHEDYTSLGWATAIRNGALGAFAEEHIAYAMPEKISSAAQRNTEKDHASKEKLKSDILRITGGKSHEELKRELNGLSKKAREYDNINNEGHGGGYNPHKTRRDDIEWVLSKPEIATPAQPSANSEAAPVEPTGKDGEFATYGTPFDKTRPTDFKIPPPSNTPIEQAKHNEETEHELIAAHKSGDQEKVRIAERAYERAVAQHHIEAGNSKEALQIALEESTRIAKEQEAQGRARDAELHEASIKAAKESGDFKQGHSALAEPLSIDPRKETEKAYAVPNENYMGRGYYAQHRWAKGEDVARHSHNYYQKSHVSVHDGHIIGMPEWLAKEKGHRTQEGAAREAEIAKTQAVIEDSASKRYHALIEHAKNNGVKGVRSGMRTSTILDKMKEAGVEPPESHGGAPKQANEQAKSVLDEHVVNYSKDNYGLSEDHLEDMRKNKVGFSKYLQERLRGAKHSEAVRKSRPAEVSAIAEKNAAQSESAPTTPTLPHEDKILLGNLIRIRASFANETPDEVRAKIAELKQRDPDKFQKGMESFKADYEKANRKVATNPSDKGAQINHKQFLWHKDNEGESTSMVAHLSGSGSGNRLPFNLSVHNDGTWKISHKGEVSEGYGGKKEALAHVPDFVKHIGRSEVNSTSYMTRTPESFGPAEGGVAFDLKTNEPKGGQMVVPSIDKSTNHQGIQKPTKPSYLTGSWNGKVYSGNRVFIGGEEKKLSDQQISELKKYNSDYAAYKDDQGKLGRLQAQETISAINAPQKELTQSGESAPKYHAIPNKPYKTGVLLTVPFDEKEKAKALGARWSSELHAMNKKHGWHVPEGVEFHPDLHKYRIDSEVNYTEDELRELAESEYNSNLLGNINAAMRLFSTRH